MLHHLRTSTLAYLTIIIIGVGWILIAGASIILPLLYGALLSVVLNPITKFIYTKVIKHQLIAIFLSYVAVIVPLALIVFVITLQIGNIIDSLPTIGSSLQNGMESAISSIKGAFPFIAENKTIFNENTAQSLIEGPLGAVRTGLMSSSQILFSGALALLYSVFFLIYRKSLKAFIIYQFQKSERKGITKTLLKMKETIQAYIGGLGLVVLILSILNSLGLWIIGIDYALFWGILAGLLAVIPYVGTIIGGLLPFTYSLATSDYSLQPAAVAIYYFVIQQLEGNIITPKIVGNQVNLNPLFSIFSIILFAYIWGVGGVILALPIVSIIRIIFEQFEETRSLAILMSANVKEDAYKFKEFAKEQLENQ